jgi:serine/threonine protein kinase/Tol biopolymer transport system component
MTLERGALLHNRYRILDILGQGGMGSIYRAVDDNLGVEVAVKENLFTSEEYARQFRREAIILANLRHPNLPRVSDHFVIEGQGQYLIMDYIEGEDLRERMDRVGIMPEADVIVIGVALCDALTYMHTQKPPVLHRDLKPGNVRITPDGRICLVDFGLAKVVQSGQQTTTGARAMTPGYSPPEQYGAARTDHRSDVYSLGATLYAALVGTIPEDSLARTMEQTELTPIRKRNPKVSRRLASAIEKALNVHPDDRFQSAEEFKIALLNARGITLRKLADSGTLPPESYDQNIYVDDEPSSEPKLVLESSPIGGKSPLPLPSSESIEELDFSPPSRRKKKQQQGIFLYVLLVILLLVIAGLVAYTLDPSLPNRVVAFLPISVQSSPTPTTERNAETQASMITTMAFTPTEVTILPTETETPEPSPTQSPTSIPMLVPTDTPSPSVTPTPDVTPLGGGPGQIAFASDRSGIPQIWLINVDGSDLFQVTNAQQGACQPDWSPDGSQIVFISPCTENQEKYRGSSLFIINADGSGGMIPLPTQGGSDYDPSWSPDGNSIAFTSLRNGDRPQIFVLNLLDSTVIQLSESGTNQDFQPDWSPDGSALVFVTTRRGPYQIWSMAADGNDAQRFTASGNRKNTYPAFSADGQVVTFTQTDGADSVPVLKGARYPFNGENEFKIYPFPGLLPMREAEYSPDGFWLVFESWPEGSNHDIYVMTANGAERTQITKDPAFDFDPSWRPISP